METENPVKKIPKKRFLLTIAIITVFIFGFTGGYLIGNNNTDATGSATDIPPHEAERLEVPNGADDDGFKGDENAPITIIEFSDYQCPYCRYFYTETYNQIVENYVDKGIVKMVYRDFPLGFHDAAIPYGMAAECAQDQGLWKEMHDKLYDEQNELGQGAAAYVGDETIKEWAREIGLDGAEFDDCFDNEKHLEEMQTDYEDGRNAGVTGTPAFFIGNDKDGYILVKGARKFEVFQEVIEYEQGSALSKFLGRFF